MSKNLVIVESPAKARTINRFLGKDFQVESCYGHIRDLPKNQLGVDIKNGFEPTYQIIPGRKKMVEKLKKLSRKMKRVYLATDLDREGEAISWHLSQELNHKETVRVIFNQITKQAIQKAIKNSSQIDLNKVNAQQGRRVLDRLVGYKISPLLWKKVKRGLSAGRVQSVAVKLICEREREIGEFNPQEYWTVSAMFNLLRKRVTLEAKLTRIDEKKADLKTEDKVREVAEKIKKEKYSVDRIKEEQRKRSPSPPFITSTLQQMAWSRLGFSAVRTMRIAQNLYEGQEIGSEGRVGLITYMRTDSVRVAREAQEQARKYLRQTFGEEFLPKSIPHYKNKKSSQNAHEAIRPTSIWRTPDKVKPYLSKDLFKLYDLIWRRFLASQMTKMILKVVTLDIRGGSFLFKAESRKVEFPGFTLVYKEKVEERKALPSFEEGSILRLKELILKQCFTQPPSHYTEATLIKTLEDKEIGRPSTYAPIISTIKDRGYIRQERGRLVPTPLAKVVTELLGRSFSTILDTGFTAQMEEGLDVVEQGEKEWTVLVGEFYEYFEKDLEKAEEEMRNVKESGLKMDNLKCDKCGADMVLKFGRYGEFLACSNYPTCKNTKPLIITTGVQCPSSGCDGQIIQRTSKRGKLFYGCSRFPQCKFVLKDEPLNEKCPHCGNSYLVKVKGQARCPECGKRVDNYVVEEKRTGNVLLKIMRRRMREGEISGPVYSLPEK